MFKFGRSYDNFIIFIIFVKVIFVIFDIIEKYYGYKIKQKSSYTPAENKQYTQNYQWAKYWKERVELIFIILMALVCIVVFYPFYSDTVYIDKDTRLLLFIYGFVILITANWSVIQEPPPWFIDLQNILD
jgi:hypothetical protein